MAFTSNASPQPPRDTGIRHGTERSSRGWLQVLVGRSHSMSPRGMARSDGIYVERFTSATPRHWHSTWNREVIAGLAAGASWAISFDVSKVSGLNLPMQVLPKIDARL